MTKTREHDPRQPTNFETPSSAQILGLIVDALGARQGVLADRHASRFFSGQPVLPERRQAYLSAIAEQLLNKGIIPAKVVERLPAKERVQVLAGAIEWHSNRWDQLGAYVYARAARVVDRQSAIHDYLRLVVVDVSLRVVAALWLSGGELPGTDIPAWAGSAGTGPYLNSLRQEAGMTRDSFADLAGVSKTAVDNWLKPGSVRPTDDHLNSLSLELAEALGTKPDTLLGKLRRLYFFSAIAEKLKGLIGSDSVELFAQSLVIMVHQSLKLHRQAFPYPDSAETDDSTTEREISRAHSILVLGASSPGARLFLETMAEHIGDYEWNVAVRAVSLDWSLYIESERLRDGSISLAGDDPPLSGGFAALHEGLMQERDASIDALFRGDVISAIESVVRRLIISEVALAASPGDAWLHFHVGSTIGKFIDADRGIAECWIAAELEPTWELPRVEIGIILINSGRLEEGRAHMEDLFNGWPEPTWHLMYTLGESRERCGDFAEALDAYEVGLATNPAHAIMIDRAAHCAFETGDKGKGSTLAKKAHTLGISGTYLKWRSGNYRKKRKR